ncbi:histidine phosphatase family protein [Ectothiorhodospiraceae bacterium WFHF3C12]|nr:histidine phosphatase family protein [Ectothiorhodospiraceae bacterium WFHF3C12]
MSIQSRTLRGSLFLAVLTFVLTGSPALSAATGEALWNALRSGGHVVLMRHAIAPGTGDPADFELGDCSTQRNLSERGREQARNIGERFRSNEVSDVAVYSSQWCRCLDTARLLGLGEVTPYEGLNSFFGRREQRDTRLAQMRELIDREAGGRTLVLVTHQVNITGLTGVFPSSGEMVVVKPGESGLEVVGTLPP